MVFTFGMYLKYEYAFLLTIDTVGFICMRLLVRNSVSVVLC